MPLPTLPPELWREIVSLATYTLTCFDTSPHPDTWSPLAKDFIERYEANVRTKRALAFVSWQFHQITLEFLCDILIIGPFDCDPVAGVVCRQLGQIAPLVPYLPTTQHLLVDIKGQGSFDDVGKSLEQILRQCHNLQGLYLSFPRRGPLGTMTLSLQTPRGVHRQMQVFKAICPGVQFLDIRGIIWVNVCETLLNRVSRTLRAHRMSAMAKDLGGFSGIVEAQDIIFPQLISLSLSISGVDNLSISKFNMPALTYLVIGIPSPRHILTQILEFARDSILTLRLGELCVVDNDILSIAFTAPHLQTLDYPVSLAFVPWLNDEVCHNSLREIYAGYSLCSSPFGTADPDDIIRDHFHPISKHRFPMLNTVTVAPTRYLRPTYDVLGVYDLEDGKRLEDADSVRPRKLYFHGI